ncbi:MAG: tetratricopeptide repeat protein [Rectinemataceae bacterium]|nr:tetratricopeptide repeat protein [Rectinemataceae bacterium]
MDNNNARKMPGQPEGKKTLVVQISDFIRKYRVVFLAVLAALLVVFVVIVLWTTIASATLRNSTIAMEKAEKDFTAWKAENDQAKKDELLAGLSKSLTGIENKWSRSFAGQQSLILQARILESKKDFEGAEKLWVKASEKKADSYLAPMALQGAANAADERGAPEKALEYYNRLITKFSASSVGLAHAYFSVGRLQEEKKDYKAALKAYEDAISKFPDDDWSKLAKDRVIYINSNNLAK